MYVINTMSASYYNPNIFDPVNMFVFNITKVGEHALRLLELHQAIGVV